MNSKKILLAGATGYLGSYIAQVLQEKSWNTTIIARNTSKLEEKGIAAQKVIKADLTNPDDLTGCFEGIEIVISTVGITRQKDGLSYMDVDYQVNKNLLEEAQKAGVSKFIYISALNGDKLRHVKICEAKERFVDELKASGMDYCIVRPNGFFSDMGDFFAMAKSGRAYLFGDGEVKTNPIHGRDLAEFCVQMIDSQEKEPEIGGPEILSQNEIAELAFEVQGKPVKITHIPHWIRRTVLFFGKLFIPSKTFGPIEFFMNVLAMEMIAPTYGARVLRDHFGQLEVESNSNLN